MIFLRLYYEFAKVGLFSIGGGLATIPFLYDLADRTAWFSHADVANMIAIAESTPGAIGVNMATYAGYTTAGVPGGIIATLGLITPAIVIITLVARILNHFMNNPYVESAFRGLRPASIALIAAAGISVAKVSLLDLDAYAETGTLSDLIVWKAVILGVLLFLGQKYFPKVHPVVFIALSAVVGIIFQFAGV
ncbi:MAG: chromate transporter [Lachnospiraceae bacterium]|nr:chromate transporter [Lachnospiraceae bacterium]